MRLHRAFHSNSLSAVLTKHKLASSFTQPSTPAAASANTRLLTTPITSFRNSSRRTPFTRSHFEERIVPFSQNQLYNVVSNIDDYHTFVPWCTGSRVAQRVDDRHLVADLTVGFRILSENYTSVITLDPNRAVSADVPNSGLFDYLITDWTFDRAGHNQTRLSFYVEFAFRNTMYQRVTDLFFEEVVRQMVGAFEQQCYVKYRSPDPAPGILHRW